MSQSPLPIHLDLAIIGGGVAGLWLANRAKRAGFSIALFEAKALGSEQTLASQGMIHGGMKYTLAGALTGASEAIAEMPKHWRACLCGEGDVDLRHTRILSDHFFMWSGDDLGSKLTGFLASKITRGRVEPVHQDRRPPLLRHKDFTGSLYRLEDIVIDAPSLVANLALNVKSHCFQIDWSQAKLHKNAEGKVSLRIDTPEQPLEIHAQRFVFTAGKGNAELLQQLGLASPAMQLRPLQQVMVKHHHPFDFYGHCLGQESTPRLTISSHRLPDGAQVWYLGGSLAEKGAGMTPDDLIEQAKQELGELIPWVNLEGAEWATLPIARAEPLQPGLLRPDNAFIAHAEGASNLLVGWPTKLTLAPNLANQALDLLGDAGITQSHNNINLHQYLPYAELAKTPWELAFPPAMSAEEALALRFREPDDEDDQQ
ncbi:NAD(P)/FAD-dependent oxidoreductase [Cellvibrio sp. OA-2007]|uniref:NAD(P)/FAD-dependent oxidoreductase n=1 Tax=Cellvibrio sp. OA-2007 TaxID=529823 RepID=UPI0007828C44|nr:FAD-dependent oxidoreductase [Cellvibrio sp. OA-2007]